MIVRSLQKLMFSQQMVPILVESEPGTLPTTMDKIARYKLDMINNKIQSALGMSLGSGLPLPPIPGADIAMSMLFNPLTMHSFDMLGMIMGANDIEVLDSFDTVKSVFPQRTFNAISPFLDISKMAEDARNLKGFVTTDIVFDKMGINEAHQKGITGAGVNIGILDTGIDNSNEGFMGKVSSLAVPPHPTFIDENGHGTNVAGDVVANLHKNYRGVWVGGIAPDAHVYAIKVLGFGIGTGTTAGIIKGIEMAAENGCKVVSMSLGSAGVPERESALALLINKLTVEKNMIFVVAAGNDGPDVSTIGTPGCASRAITVGSVRSDNAGTSGFSSRGPSPDGLTKPDIAGLGGDSNDPREYSYNTIAKGSLADGMNDKVLDGYAGLMGTSMSTPKVAALIALWCQTFPNLTQEDVMNIFQRNGHNKNNSDGYGFVKYDWLDVL